MAWKEVETGKATDIKKHKGTSYVGVYKGNEEISTKIGKQIIYHFQDEEGEDFSIYGFTNLNRAMEHVEPETDVRITYLGMVNTQTKYGMKDVHQVKVEIDVPDEIPTKDIKGDLEPF